MEYVDTLPNDVIQGIISPANAVLAGRMKVSDVDQVRRFNKAFPFDPVKVIEVAERHRHVLDQENGPTAKAKFDIVFTELLPACFNKEAVDGWDAVLHFRIEGADDYTVQFAAGNATTAVGLNYEATCEVRADAETFSNILRFNTLNDATNASPEPLSDGTRARTALKAISELHDSELSDAMLEAVAGGKGCGAEASGAQFCGGDACGAAAGAIINICGRDACAAAAGGVNICGAAACAVEASAGGACAAEACAAAAGAGTVCGAAACLADASAGAACGIDGGYGACVGDACGAAVGKGACAANTCGVDVLTGVDIGPCIVNVIPVVPLC